MFNVTDGMLDSCIRTAGMESYGWHRVHVWFCDIFDHDWDVKVPCTYGLVIGRRHEPPVVINEGDSVHRTEMLVVFLGNLARVHIILHKDTASTNLGVQ